jgi:hypothetical protein
MVTVPVGVPAPDTAAEMIALKVTGWPKGAGFALDDNPIVTRFCWMLSVTVGEVAPAKLLSPE